MKTIYAERFKRGRAQLTFSDLFRLNQNYTENEVIERGIRQGAKGRRTGYIDVRFYVSPDKLPKPIPR